MRTLSWKEKAYHTLFGLHSNIPPCCVKFFNEDWVPNRNSARHNLYWNKLLTFTGDDDMGYIPCPTCFANKRFNKIHRCKDQLCHKFRVSLQRSCGLL